VNCWSSCVSITLLYTYYYVLCDVSLTTIIIIIIINYYYHNNNDLVVADLIFTSASDGSVLLLRCEDDMCIDRQHTLVIVTVRLTSKTLFLNSLYLLTQAFYVSTCALQLFSTVF